MLNFPGWLISGLLVAVTVGIHFEIMRLVSDYVLPWTLRRFRDRRVMMVMIGSLMLGHVLEIWVFAVAMMAISFYPGLGSLTGDFDGTLNSFAYFSAVNYTSIGYGDIYPHGYMRSVSVSETLTGLLMIAWSASFTYLKMEQIWKRRSRKDTEN